ncbi:chemotaxis protein CheA [Vulcaniibacterium tengchongense]|uniref:Chemotaxis protein CheA n=1 Tax=Vulcaniibacterium tengchongense TaxID=1273429 RepID=A0A3N4VUV5_9GAMM|nr:chemotaxis protein CheW [Vulcaniibacterium tengchongense]RPE80837.1 two-component system chemotaxis sensor kinase CheA [Vulcaniibacterium tengchongense]
MDISRFHAAFFEESRENLDAMEAGLLALESGTADGETIHVVFRAAHSIKGGAATFGFTAITQLTHQLETLLDEARGGGRRLDAAAIGALLVAVDALRGLLAAAEHRDAIDEPALARAHAGLERMLGRAAAGPGKSAAPTGDAGPGRWRIGFTPAPTLFTSGNDPLRILRELAGHGELDVACLDARLPAFAEMDPFEAYLAWDLMLPGTVPRKAIEDAFAWVEDECELAIEAVPETSALAPPPAGTAGNVVAFDRGGDARAARGDADGSIRVAVAKVDALINLVGELVITQAMLRQRSAQLDPVANEALLAGLEQLDRNTRDLQEAVMGVRMLPVEFAFSRFPRMVRDLAARLDKKVRLRTHGEGTELDKGVIEKIVDPLVHLVRNAIDHGLESPQQRREAGKDETGTLTLSAAHQGGHIVIEISDDGRGLDRDKILAKAAERGLAVPDNPSDAQVWDLVFHPGFSTADRLTDLSGRGVGMDVVRKNIAALGGQVEIRSRKGAGTTVSIRLPLTLAILDGMLVSVGGEVFILPLNAVVESLQPASGDVRTIAGEARLLRVREDYLPLVDLAAQFGLPGGRGGAALAVVVESDGSRLALEVDDLLGQQQVVVKNLEANYRRVRGISGATILGDGRVALIVDAAGLAQAQRLQAA